MTNPGRARRPGKIQRIKAGSAQVPIYESSVRGATRFTIAFYRDGRRVRRSFDSLERATEEARLAARKIQQGLAETTDLRPQDRENYLAAVALLRGSPIPLVAAVEEYVRCRKLLGDAPLFPAVEEYLRRTRGVRLGASVAEVIKEFLTAKEQDGVSKRYLAQLRSDVNRFSTAFDGPIMRVKSEDIDGWLRGLGVAPRTRNQMLTSIRTLFSFAKSRSFLPKSEVSEAEALGKAKVGDTETVIFTPAQMRDLIMAASPILIPFLAIGAFAGLRAAEIARLDWSALNLERGIIEVRAGQAKTASRRIVPITDNLAAWLRPHIREGRVIHTPEIYRHVSALAKEIGIEWPRNVLRHSYISYRLPIVKSADQVALEAGNSPAIIFKHYRELATENDAKEWFAIMPPARVDVAQVA
jgi:integrase